MSNRSRNNIRKRGSTWTYYVYETAGDGRRNQISKGGFAHPQGGGGRPGRGAGHHGQRHLRPPPTTDRRQLPGRRVATQPATTHPRGESTHRSYERDIALHVAPYIGGIALQRLTPMDLNRLYRTLLEGGRRPPTPPRRQHDHATVELISHLRAEGLTWQGVADAVGDAEPDLAGISRHAVASLHRRSQAPRPDTTFEPGLKPRTVRYVHTILHAALKDAVRWNRLARNVADAADPPPVGSTKRGRPPTWDGDQLRAFLDHVGESRYLPPWLFLATTGCRRGEALGLKWSDVDLEAATAIISRQVTAIDHELRIKELPKTKAGHTIRLDPGTVAMLRSWRATQAEERLVLGPGYHDDGFVFTQADGSVYHPDRFSREFLRKQASHNRDHPDRPLPRLVLHGLRHTWATLALREGIDIHIVSERLDHSSTHITSEIYTHVTPPMQFRRRRARCREDLQQGPIVTWADTAR